MGFSIDLFRYSKSLRTFSCFFSTYVFPEGQRSNEKYSFNPTHRFTKRSLKLSHYRFPAGARASCLEMIALLAKPTREYQRFPVCEAVSILSNNLLAASR
jgi:hypothetical protein